MRLLTATAALAAATPAWAYCRATTCNPMKQSCTEDTGGCITQGLPVYWESSCITVSVQANGAPNADINYETARGAVERAFETWTNVECPQGGKPSITVVIDGPVTCDTSEYNSDKRNANVVMFRDQSWPYEQASQDVLGYTDIHFDPDAGALYDVDIEINAVSEPLSAGRNPTMNEIDLDSVVTHEAGHLLGLNHSTSPGATMEAGYESGSIDLRTPSADDIAAICEIYPPGRKAGSDSCEPRHGYSELCAKDQPEDVPVADPGGGDESIKSGGCSVAPGHQERGESLLALCLGLGAAFYQRRSRSRRSAKLAP